MNNTPALVVMAVSYTHLPQVEAYANTLEGDEKVGAQIIRQALEIPARQIAENAGFDGSVVVAEILGRGNGVGLDVLKGEYVPMLESGIVDPAKVTRLAPVSYTHLDVYKRQAQVALQFLKRRPIVKSILMGARSIRQLEQNLDAYAADVPDDLMEEIEHASEPLRDGMGENADLWISDNGGRFY